MTTKVWYKIPSNKLAMVTLAFSTKNNQYLAMIVSVIMEEQ